MIRNMVQCYNCGDVIESTYRHDFVSCKCGAIAVDGGRDYHKVSFKELTDIIPLYTSEDRARAGYVG